MKKREQSLSPEKRALMARMLAERGISGNRIRRSGSPGPHPLSSAQERMFYFHQLLEGHDNYIMSVALRLRGALDEVALERAFAKIGDRHSVLRSVFRLEGGRPVQVVCEDLVFQLGRMDLSDRDETERGRLTKEYATRLDRESIDLSTGPPVRATLLTLGSDEYVLLVNLHHIVSDGWSLGVIGRELSVLYSDFAAGRPSSLPDLQIQYSDFARWEQERISGEAISRDLTYWRKQLADVPNLPLESTVPVAARVTGNSATSVPVTLPAAMVADLEILARGENASFFMTLLAAFNILLFHFFGQSDFCVGTPIALRQAPEIRDSVGLYLNTLALRAPLDPQLGFRTYLRAVRRVVLESFSHQSVPFELMVKELAPRRSPAFHPFFQVMFMLQNATPPGSDWQLGELTGTNESFQVSTTRFPIELHLFEQPGSVSGMLLADTTLLPESAVAELAGNFVHILEDVLRDPERPPGVLSITQKDRPRQEQPVIRRDSSPRGTVRSEGGRQAGVSATTANRSAVEERLLSIWRELLGRSDIAVTDDFFELGGHSLLIVRMLARLRAEFREDLSVATLLSATTIRRLAPFLGETSSGSVSLPLVPLQTGGDRTPLFLIHPGGGSPLCFLPLARLIGERPVFGFQAPGLEGEGATPSTITDFAETYIAALKTVQPEGPYHIGGWSAGGVIAFEMARLLEKNGEAVGLLAMLDAGFLNSSWPAEISARLFSLAHLAGNILQLPLPRTSQEINDLFRMAGLHQPANSDSASPRISQIVEWGSRLITELPRMVPVFRAVVQALHDYVPEPIRGEISLFYARDDFLRKESRIIAGWKRIAGSVAVFAVPGTHMTLLDAAHVGPLAKQLASRMNELDPPLVLPGNDPDKKGGRPAEIPSRFAVLPTDRPGRFQKNPVDGSYGIQLKLAGRIDHKRLERGYRLTLDALPILGCRFIARSFGAPGWERRADLDEIARVEIKVPSVSDHPAIPSVMEEFMAPPMDAALHPLFQILLVRGENDTLCFKINTAITDQHGARVCLENLANIYSALELNPEFYPEPDMVRGGEYRNLLGFDRMSIAPERFGRFLFAAHESEFCDDARIYDARTENKSVRPATVSYELAADENQELIESAECMRASLAEVLLAAYLRVAFGHNENTSRHPLIFAREYDLRAQLSPHTPVGVCQLTGCAFAELGSHPGSSLEATVRRIKRLPVAADEITLPADRFFSSLAPAALRKAAGWPLEALDQNETLRAPVFHDAGEFNPGRLAFGRVSSGGVRIFPGLFPNADSLLTIHRFSDTLSLTMAFDENQFDRSTRIAFLQSIVKEALPRKWSSPVKKNQPSAPDVDPLNMYRAMRVDSPVQRPPDFAGWLVIGYDECVAVLKNTADFSSSRMDPVLRTSFPNYSAERFPHLGSLYTRPVLFIEGDAHTAARSNLRSLFTADRIRALREFVELKLDGILSGAAERGGMDFQKEVAAVLPLALSAHMVGLELEADLPLNDWVRDASLLNPHAGDRLARGEQAMKAFGEYLQVRLDTMATDSPLRIFAKVAREQFERAGTPKSACDVQMSVVAHVMQMLIGGSVTSLDMLGTGLLALLENQDQLDRVRRQRDGLTNAIEEMLRYTSPVQMDNRVANQDLELSGKKIKAGEIVYVVLAAANRDPHVFEDPDRFDVGRSNAGRHIAFGYGAHYCAGAGVARMLADVVFSRVLDRLPGIRTAGPPVWRNEGILGRGLHSLPVTWDVPIALNS